MKIKGLRWWIIGLVALGTAINYLARSSLSVAASTLFTELHITEQQYSWVIMSFQMAYTVAQSFCGYILDSIGLRIGFFIFALAWSFANMAHGLAFNWQSLACFRGLLGLSEAAAIPAGIKTASEWFPSKERGVAGGLFNIGTSVGAMLAPPIVVWAIISWHWQFAFIISGGLGIIFAFMWLFLYRSPENLKGIYNLRFVSEPDNGIYDAMNKGIAMAQGKFALFLNSGDIFHQDAANFVRKLKVQKDNVMITGDALLDFGDGHKIKRSAKPGWYIYHSLPASHQAIFFPVSGLKKWRYDLEYKVSSDYALAAKMYKAGYAFKKLNGLVSEFSMGGVSTTNNMELCADAKKVQRQILHVPGFWAELSWHLRQRTTSKTKALYNKS